VRSDGRTTHGTLRLEKTGKLLFTPTTALKAIARDDLSEVRFDTESPIFRAAPGCLLYLTNGQQIAGVFLGLEKDHLLFHTAWADRLSVPRRGAVALTHLPGWQPVFVEDFRNKLSVRRVRGEPSTSEGSVLLKKPGQSLSYILPTPIDAGRIGVNFREDGAPTGARWSIEAVFAPKSSERVVRVSLAGEKELAVDSAGLEGTAQGLERAAGWRRLRIEIGPGALRIMCDNDVLWYTLKQGPGGPLREIRLVCAESGKPALMPGGMAFGDFLVERSVPQRPRPPGEPDQDELWLAGGDQLFGDVLRADRTSVELKGRFGVRRYPWTSLRGWFLKRAKSPAITPGRGQAVRLSLHSGLRLALDVLEGELTAMDARHLTLNHPLLGRLAIPRSVVARLRPLAEKR
jgi:hypothetical protein